ncbi:MAG: carboxypeptidase-like regulatory domain-containing protein [Bryobacteraceae bacterium]
MGERGIYIRRLAQAAALGMMAGAVLAAPGDGVEGGGAGAAGHCPIEILVQDTSGARVQDAWVRVAGPVDGQGRSDAEGRFCLDGARRGRYVAAVEKTGFEKAPAEFVLEEAAVTRKLSCGPRPCGNRLTSWPRRTRRPRRWNGLPAPCWKRPAR